MEHMQFAILTLIYKNQIQMHIFLISINGVSDQKELLFYIYQIHTQKQFIQIQLQLVMVKGLIENFIGLVHEIYLHMLQYPKEQNFLINQDHSQLKFIIINLLQEVVKRWLVYGIHQY